MPETKLGNKYQCFSCGTKFYDLGKSEPICPKCGANQKDAVQTDTSASQASRRKRKTDVVKPPVESDSEVEPMDDMPEDGELVGADLEDDEIEEEEEDFDDEP